MNAESLGEDFFNNTLYPVEYFSHPSSYELDMCIKSSTAPPQLKKFAGWLLDAVIPVFNEANPNRILRSKNSRVSVIKRENDNTDVHRDRRVASDTRTFVTLGVNDDGSTSGTLFTERAEFKGQHVQSIRPEDIARHFVQAPRNFAAVFDPDTQLHAAPFLPSGKPVRFLFRAVMIHEHGEEIAPPLHSSVQTAQF